MRKIFTIFICLFAFLSVGAYAGKQAFKNRTIIQFADPVIEGNTPFINSLLQSKERRVSSKKGDIRLVYDESLPDSVIAAISLAKNLWENKLCTRQPIFIKVAFEPLGAEIAIRTDVSYFSDEGVPYFSDNKVCPTALASQIRDFAYGSSISPNGIIVFNSNLDWNCNYNKVAQEYNVTTMALRGMCRCFGFGTSIKQEGALEYGFKMGSPSNFDKLLYNDTYHLKNLRTSIQLRRFITSENVYAETPNASYKMYAPGKYIQNETLCYLDSDDSIMSYSLSNSNIALSIDDCVVDLLKAIGWDFKDNGCEITCNDIMTDGIGSSYTSHTFSLSQKEGVSGYEWRFLLKDKSDKYVLVSQGTDSDFTIGRIESPHNYGININGDLEGRIECDYIADGKEYNALPFNVSLELKPTILSIDNMTINRKGFDFSLNFDVNYRGADRVAVRLEEEYDTSLRTYRFNDPYIAHVSTGYMSSLYYSWVTVIAENKYGQTTETLVYEPTYSETYSEVITHGDSESSIMDSLIELDNAEIELISPNGTVVYKGSQESFSSIDIQPGMYIRRKSYTDGQIMTDKLIIK